MDIFKVARRHRNQLENQEAEVVGDLVARYGKAWQSIQQELDGVLAKIAQAQAEGTEISPAWFYQQRRFRAIQELVEQEVRDLMPAALNTIEGAQERAILTAMDHSSEIMGELLTGTFERTDLRNAKTLIGLAADGSPLSSLLASLPGDAGERFRTALFEGLVTGKNPKEIARQLKSGLGGNMSRALTIARTETQRAYRETTRMNYFANDDVIEGWIWHSATGPRTCAACWGRHGERFPLTERLDGHPNCRCAMIPDTGSFGLGRGVKGMPLNIEPGPQLFDKQPDAIKLAVLGPKKFQYYKKGQITLRDVVGRKARGDWGTMTYELPLKVILKGKNIQPIKTIAPARIIDETVKPIPAAADLPAWRADLERIKADLPANVNQIANDFERVENVTFRGNFTGFTQKPGPQGLRHEATIRQAGKVIEDQAQLRLKTLAAQEGITDGATMRAQADRLLDSRNEIELQRQARRREVELEVIREYGGVDTFGSIPDKRKMIEAVQEQLRRFENDPLANELKERFFRIGDEAMALVKRADTVDVEYQHLVRRAYLETLSELREMGPGSKRHSTRVIIDLDRDDLKEAVEKPLEVYPRAWVDQSADYGPIAFNHSDRGYYDHNFDRADDSFLVISNNKGKLNDETFGYSTAMHEWGHRFESVYGLDPSDPSSSVIRRLEAVFYQRRTRNTRGNQERIKQLKGYQKGEMYRQDKFLVDYAGKDYGNTSTSSYEVFTMGIESIFTGRHVLDDDHRAFVLGLLALI